MPTWFLNVCFSLSPSLWHTYSHPWSHPHTRKHSNTQTHSHRHTRAHTQIIPYPLSLIANSLYLSLSLIQYLTHIRTHKHTLSLSNPLWLSPISLFLSQYLTHTCTHTQTFTVPLSYPTLTSSGYRLAWLALSAIRSWGPVWSLPGCKKDIKKQNKYLTFSFKSGLKNRFFIRVGSSAIFVITDSVHQKLSGKFCTFHFFQFNLNLLRGLTSRWQTAK